jgi:starch phosphorylase
MTPTSTDTEETVAYFTMEIGLETDMKTYSGGLGILAGDTMRGFADRGVPAVGVTQLNDLGYCRQELLDDGTQVSHPDEWSPEAFLDPVDVTATVEIEGRDVLIKPWRYVVESETGGEVPVYFLDTDWPENDDEARDVTRRLYGAGRDRRYRLMQEVVLGIGGCRILDALGYDVDTYHLNEGHASLLTLELLASHDPDPSAVRDRCVFTTHTPVPGGHDEFDYWLADAVVPDLVPDEVLREHAGEESLHTTRLALSLSSYANAVSKRHQTVTHEMFPAHRVDAVTNGVHVPTWVAEPFRALYDEHVPGWRERPKRLRTARRLPVDAFLDAHRREKERFVDYVADQSGVELDPEICTLGFARRAAGYKRADLPFRDPDRLRSIARTVGGIQFVYAGKAFPGDTTGEELIRTVYRNGHDLQDDVGVVYLEDYDMEMGHRLTAGVDVWLNNPRRPLEACGTSGMKAALNGVPQLGTLDGWWLEGHVEGVTGWAIGPSPDEVTADELDADAEDAIDAGSLYDALERRVLPTYYDDRERWGTIARDAVAFNGAHFSAGRMVDEYVSRAYRR